MFSKKVIDEILYKLGIVQDDEDLRESYNMEQREVENAINKVINGEWPMLYAHERSMIADEMQNAVDIAKDNGDYRTAREFRKVVDAFS